MRSYRIELIPQCFSLLQAEYQPLVYPGPDVVGGDWVKVVVEHQVATLETAVDRIRHLQRDLLDSLSRQKGLHALKARAMSTYVRGVCRGTWKRAAEEERRS